MSTEELTIVFKQGCLTIELATEGIHNVYTRYKSLVPGQKNSITAALRQFRWKGEMTFDLDGQGFQFIQGSVRNSRLDFLTIISSKNKIFTWNDWVVQFMESSDFIMAWVADSEYQHWQNASDPLQYTAVGRSFEHLPLKSNGLPFPLEQKIIDISENPGRRIFRNGYIEVIGAEMWLGELFWALTGADKIQVVNTKWLEVSNPATSVVKIRSSEKCFTTGEGAAADVQSKLRSLLFPDAAGS